MSVNAQNAATAWYTNAYSGPFRSSRIRAPSHLGQARFMNSNANAIQQTLVVDAARALGVQGVSEGENKDKNVRRRETIFGPDVGEDDEPGWTKPGDGVKVSVDVVKGWVEKAKSEEGLHATTTLQALVNLKRPTLLLQQLDDRRQSTSSSIDRVEAITAATTEGRMRSMSGAQANPLHQLKFNYDATSPLVRVTLSVCPFPSPVVAGKEPLEEVPRVIYSGVHDGGFNKEFILPAEAALDLSSAIAPMIAQLPDEHANALGDVDEKKSEANITSPDARASHSEDTNRSSIERQMGNLHVASSTQPDLATVPELGAPQASQSDERRSRRFGIFPRRGHRDEDLEAGQIELMNRDAENGEKKEELAKEPENGMRLLINIEAVTSEGQLLKRRNAQLTHILVTGMWAPDASSTAPVGQNGKRVWVVKVVRREAVIGAHTFLLKEIYGLSSSTTKDTPTATSYPPQAGVEDPYASTPNECIVCLTSPRDVVLLPCRHLVVCRDCAIGMVEFGAGGKVGRRDDIPAATEVAADAAPAGGATTAPTNVAPVPQVSGGTTATARERRKKKPKGWYCPVCRQPYTSLLRLALPSSSKPQDQPHEHSRAPSIRSVRPTNSLHRVPSLAPTLPDGAELMLGNLHPAVADEEDDGPEDYEDATEDHRPQFVLAPTAGSRTAVDTKPQTEHREAAPSSGNQVAHGAPNKEWEDIAL